MAGSATICRGKRKMSGIAAITASLPQPLPPTVSEQPASISPTATDGKAGGGNVGQPAVIVTLSSNAVAASQGKPVFLGALDPNKVADALYGAAGANGLAQLDRHVDRTSELAKFGTAISQRNQASLQAAVASSASDALSHASSLGIPIHNSVSPDAVKNGAAPGTISVGAFSFINGGSTYTVTSGKDGMLVGTKDGQAGLPCSLPIPQARQAATMALPPPCKP